MAVSLSEVFWRWDGFCCKGVTTGTIFLLGPGAGGAQGHSQVHRCGRRSPETPPLYSHSQVWREGAGENLLAERCDGQSLGGQALLPIVPVVDVHKQHFTVPEMACDGHTCKALWRHQPRGPEHLHGRPQTLRGQRDTARPRALLGQHAPAFSRLLWCNKGPGIPSPLSGRAFQSWSLSPRSPSGPVLSVECAGTECSKPLSNTW